MTSTSISAMNTDLIAELAASFDAQAKKARKKAMFEAAGAYEDCADELRTHHAELEAALRDAARYRWLRDSTFNQICLSRNGDHACNYVSAKEWIEECSPEWFDGEPVEEVEKMKASGTIWKLQIYPNTPIGFYVLNRSTLDNAIDAAMNNSAKDEVTP